jgi:hypothetical protein
VNGDARQADSSAAALPDSQLDPAHDAIALIYRL